MGKILENLNVTLVIGLILALALMAGLNVDNLPPVVVLTWRTRRNFVQLAMRTTPRVSTRP